MNVRIKGLKTDPSEAEEIINALEPILQAPDKKQRTQAIKEAAETLGKRTRSIRRMLTTMAHEGVATLVKGRDDKGQYRISKQWRDISFVSILEL